MNSSESNNMLMPQKKLSAAKRLSNLVAIMAPYFKDKLSQTPIAPRQVQIH